MTPEAPIQTFGKPLKLHVASWLVETSCTEDLAAVKTTELNLYYAPGLVWFIY